MKKRRNTDTEARPGRGAGTSSDRSGLKSLEELQRLLEANKAELEARDGELKKARQEAEEYRAKYRDLYDISPVAYLSLDRRTAIFEINLTGARLLGVERPAIMQQLLRTFIADDDRPVLDRFIAAVFASDTAASCELTIAANGTERRVRIEGSRSTCSIPPEPHCRAVITDLTERRRSESALRASEERLRFAIQNAPVSIAAQDRDLRFIYAYNQTTVSPDEVIGKTDADLFPPADAERLVAIKRRVLETGVAANERLWITSGGIRLFLDLFVEPLRGERGGVVGIAIATINQTRAKITEMALRENERLLTAIFNGVTESLMLVELDGTVLAANETAAARMRLTAAECAGKNAFDILPDEVRETRRAQAARMIAEGKEVHFRDRRDGFHFEITFYPIRDDGGAISRFVIFSRDITALDRSETSLREARAVSRNLHDIINRSPVMVIQRSTGDGQPITFASDNVRQLGYQSRDLVDGRIGWLSMVHPEDAGRLNAEVARYLDIGVDEFILQYRLQEASGASRWMQELTRVVRDSERGSAALEGMIWDVTERVTAERELQGKMEALRAANDELTRFNAIMVDREIRMIELKEQINRLSERLGMPAPYRAAAAEEDAEP